MIENILAWFETATHYDISIGRGWYQSALLECKAIAREFAIDLERVVFAVAVLSPQLKWETNIAAARAVIGGAVKFPGVYSSNIEKAHHIIWDATDWRRWLSGPKVESFAQNILGCPDTVTVDTWAWRVWAGSELRAKVPNLAKLYWQIAEDYREAASRLGLEPRQLQAVTWVAIRRVANGRASIGQLSLDL